MAVELLGAMDDMTPETEFNVAPASDKSEGAKGTDSPQTSERDGSTASFSTEGASEGGDSEHPAEEPLLDIDGEKVPLSQVKKVLKEYKDDSGWKDKNRRESEELNRMRDELRRKASDPLELLRPIIEQRPEILTDILKPQVQRDPEAELQAHYTQKPNPFDTEAMTQWEIKRDMLVGETVTRKARRDAEGVLSQRDAWQHNERIEQTARERFVKSNKVSEEEFRQMAKYIVDGNVPIKDGKAPDDAFEVAYWKLFRDRYEADIRVDAAKKAVSPLKDAKSRTGEDPGIINRQPPKSEIDEEDSAFANAVKRNSRGGYQKLPT